MKAFEVKRDEQGFWTHPQLPKWDEGTSMSHAKAWFANHELDCDLVIMDGELGEQWVNGEIESCLDWQPSIDIDGAFLVGIWDTEDGVVAMFAFPKSIASVDISEARRIAGRAVPNGINFSGKNRTITAYLSCPDLVLALCDEVETLRARLNN